MAVTIVNVSDSVFSVNGIEYQKHFQSLVSDNLVRIVNIYDSKIEIVGNTNYTNFTINGSTFGSAENVQSALVPIMFNRELEGIEGRLDNLEDNQVTGVIQYSTLAELPATGTLNVSYKVTNDGSNNGYYHWNGSSYIKDASLFFGEVVDGDVEAVEGGKIFDSQTNRFLERGKNKIETSLFLDGYEVYRFNGNVVQSGTDYITGFQKVTPSTNYVLSHTTADVGFYVVMYDENKTYLGSSFSLGVGELRNGVNYFKTPANCYFINAQQSSASITFQQYKDGVQLEKGVVITNYEAPNYQIKDILNTLNSNDLILTPLKNYYDISMVSDDEWINQAGVVSSSASLGLTRIPVNAEATYCFRHSDDSYVWGAENGISFFDADGILISAINLSQLDEATGLGGKVIVTPANCAYIYKNNNQTGHDYRSDFTLELGIETTVYEPYLAEVDSLLGKPLKDNLARTELEIVKASQSAKENELESLKGFNYKSESLSQIFDSLDQIRTDALNQVENASLSLPSSLTLGSSFVLLKSYTSESIIENIKLDVSSVTPLGLHKVYVYVINSDDIIVQNQGSVEINVTAAGVYSVNVNKFILPSGHFIAISTSDNLTLKYGSAVGATNSWKFFGQDPNEVKSVGDDFFALGSSSRGDAVAISWDATLKVFNSVLSSNYLQGLKIVGIGDSMVEEWNGYSTVKSIGLRNAMNVINLGISGNRITDTGGTGVAMCNRVADIPIDTNILMIDCGTNDALQNITIGLENSTDITEFNGALNKFLDDVLTRIPTAGIVWVGMRQGGKESYYDAIAIQCEKRQIPILNSYKLGGIYESNTAQYNALTRQDNIHLSTLGIERRSYQVEGFIRANVGGFATL